MGKICENCDWKDGDFCPHMLDCKYYSEFTPKQKTGHWIRVAGGSLIDDYRCDCCNHQPPIRKVGSTWGWDFTDYCPNCGAKMDEEAADGSISRESNISNH